MTSSILSVLRRYAGALAVLVVAVVMVAMFPSIRHDAASVAASDRSGAPPVADSAAPTATGAQGDTATSAAPASGTGAAAHPSAAQVRAATVAAITPPAATGSAGITRSGVNCGPSVLQVTWTVYAPRCIPGYHGSNGGATAHGVTADTITVSLRRGNLATETAAIAAAGSAAPPADDLYIADLQTYFDFFNKNYELYGRHVVLKPFQGQGDNIAEASGQGQQQAASDAATAYDLGAFADVTSIFRGSKPWWTSLANEKVVAFGPPSFPQSWYERYSPYWYTEFGGGTEGAQWLASLACQRLNGMNADFAGDATYQHTTRSFALIHPDLEEYTEVARQIEAAAAAPPCGLKMLDIAYAFDVPRMQDQSTAIAAQLHSKNITTVICGCDPLLPAFLSRAADQQQYQPEWWELAWGDGWGRLREPKQWAHAIGGGLIEPGPAGEASQVFKLASGGAAPKENDYTSAYRVAVHLFAGLQAAGPNLTPFTLRSGMFSLPTSRRGPYGVWSYGPGAYSPITEAQVTWWSPTAKSTSDEQTGAWVACDDATMYPFTNRSAWGPARTPLRCFGR